jgi:hypothetical protein
MQKIRMMLALAVLSVALFVGSANAASAQGPSIELTPIQRGCYLGGEIYPVGTVRLFPLDVKMKCTLSFQIVDGRIQAVYKWVLVQ